MNLPDGLRTAAEKLERLLMKNPDQLADTEIREVAWCHYTLTKAAAMISAVIGEPATQYNLAMVQKELDALELSAQP